MRVADIDKLANQIATLLLTVVKKIAVSLISIYHKGEECFWRALIGWLGGD